MTILGYASQVLGYTAATLFTPQQSIHSIKQILEVFKNGRLDKKELHELQSRRLRRLTSHAYSQVPYYRRLFKQAKVAPSDIRFIEDLHKLPIVTKSMLVDMQRANPSELLTKSFPHQMLEKNLTSGSAGIPLQVYYRPEDSRQLGIIGLRAWLENGMTRFDRRVRLVHPSLFSNHFQHNLSLLAMLGIGRTYDIPVPINPCMLIKSNYDFSILDHYKNIIPVLSKIKPHILEGYTSSLKYLAQEIKKQGIFEIRPKFVMSFAEMLDSPIRHLLATTFNTEVIDMYGAHEARTIAWECREHIGYHINADSLILEFLKDGEQVSPGELGEAVITNLFSYAMPFIRYELGDIASPVDVQCSCGCTLPMLKKLEGRIIDFIVLPSGNLVSPLAVRDLFGSGLEIETFKVLQKDRYNIEVLIVKGPKFLENTAKELKVKLAALLREEVNISISYVDEIPLPPGGKFKYVESNVDVSLCHRPN